MNPPNVARPGAGYSDLFVVLFICLSFGTMAFSIDAVAPAVDLIAARFERPLANAQLTLSAMMFGCGIGQVVFGPLADRHGRRRPLLCGVALYLAGGVLCVFAPSLEVLLFGRLCQGLGSAAPLVIGRAILRDLYTGRKLARMFSLAFGLMGLVPMLAPFLGHLAVRAIGWQGCFIVLVGYGAVLLGLALRRYHETLAEPDLEATRPRFLWQALVAVLAHRQSRFFIFIQTLINFAMFGFIIGAQQMYADGFGLAGFAFTMAYAVIGIGVLLGQVGNQFLIARLGTAPAILWTMAAIAAVALLGLAGSLGGMLGPVTFSGAMLLIVMGIMIVVANSAALVMDPQARIAGFASSLLGMFSFGGGAGGGTVLAWVYAGDPARMFTGIFALIALGTAMTWHWLRQARRRQAMP